MRMRMGEGGKTGLMRMDSDYSYDDYNNDEDETGNENENGGRGENRANENG